jgi:hypothetical protein
MRFALIWSLLLESGMLEMLLKEKEVEDRALLPLSCGP